MSTDSLYLDPLNLLEDSTRPLQVPQQNVVLRVGSKQEADVQTTGPPSDQDAVSAARNRDKRAPADLRTDSLGTMPPTPRSRNAAFRWHCQ
ncbi:hypothetical protein PoB_007636000 [Plakobranchus ocellatus]|uniref:Uncharacterized protein n=1 Tax=Plakobranchus ocellatus TaxID=259542 RepID=A0AAV4E0D3_9GAST|nr:hypothetical protein PoB_007636000 [Plakobranchus ocellatus]